MLTQQADSKGGRGSCESGRLHRQIQKPGNPRPEELSPALKRAVAVSSQWTLAAVNLQSSPTGLPLVCLAKASHCLTETPMSMPGPNSMGQSQTSRNAQSQLSAVCPKEGMDTQGDRGSWLG